MKSLAAYLRFMKVVGRRGDWAERGGGNVGKVGKVGNGNVGDAGVGEGQKR